MPLSRRVPHSAPLTAPLSRTEDAQVVPSPCQACSAFGGADWVKRDGVGVLVHSSGARCPVAVPFVWETGQLLPALAEAVAA